MADEGTEIEVNSADDDGKPINGTYRVAGGVVHVTLSDGTSSEMQLSNVPAPRSRKSCCKNLIANGVV